MRIVIERLSKTDDGLFGKLSLDWNPFTCVTCENLSKAIPTGDYPLVWNYSPHFDSVMPHLIVPGRTFIMIHPANFPHELLGCIAVGLKVDGDAIDTSQETFDELVSILNKKTGITVSVVEKYL